MRVVILGSGVVGVASAWYLSQAGHKVTVIDRQPGPAEETSAANAGQISRLCRAVGGAGRTFEGDKVDVPAPRAAGHRAGWHPVPAEMDVADAAQLRHSPLYGK